MHLDEHSDTPFYQPAGGPAAGRHRGAARCPQRLAASPPSEGWPADLGCARNTVEQAYHLLVQEGYVASRPRQRVRRAERGLPAAHGRLSALLRRAAGRSPAQQARYDFTYGNLEPGTFPARRLAGHHRRHACCRWKAAGCDAYNDPFGEESPARGHRVAAWSRSATSIAPPSQIVVQGGTQTSVQNLLTLFDAAAGHRGHGRPRLRRRALGHRTGALRHQALPGDRRRPTCSSPTWSPRGRGWPTSPPRASSPPAASCRPTCASACSRGPSDADAYILEDDYCRDFRYRERSLAPLASMDDPRAASSTWARSRSRSRPPCA